MQSRGDHSVRSVGAVHDLLNRVTDAAAPVLAYLASLHLVRVVLVVLTPCHANRSAAFASRCGTRERTAAPAQELVSIVAWQVVVHPEVRVAWISDGLTELATLDSTDVVVLTTLLA